MYTDFLIRVFSSSPNTLRKKIFFCSVNFPTLKQDTLLEDFIVEIPASLDNCPLSPPASAVRRKAHTSAAGLARGPGHVERCGKPTPPGATCGSLLAFGDSLLCFVLFNRSLFFTAGLMLQTSMKFYSIREYFLIFNKYLSLHNFRK